MESKLLSSSAEKSYAVVLSPGDEFSAQLLEFAKQQKLTAANFTAIGAFRQVEIGWFKLEKKDYERKQLEEQLEVLSLVGNIAEFDGKPKIHAHVVLGRRDFTTLGGHLLSGHVRPTLEIVLHEAPRHLHRIHDPHTGLALIRPDQPDLPPRGGRSPHAGVN
jgi:predicted DNA-binding protein with PD1-like motif